MNINKPAAGDQPTLDDNRCVRSDEHRAVGSNDVCLATGENVTHENDRITAIPTGRFNPVEGVEERRRQRDRCAALDIGVLDGRKELHQMLLHVLIWSL